MAEESEYILGVDEDECARLRFQHAVWLEQAYALWTSAGFIAGDRVLDLGSGPGFTSFELARIVGPEGVVVALDQSEGFLEFLARERDRLGLPWIEPSLGSVEELDCARESLDGAYARWLFCWLEDPGAVLARVAACVRPGGVIAIQDYLDWGAMKLVPRGPAHGRAMAACLRSWQEGGGNIDVGEELPGLAHELGLEVERFEPVARTGAVGSLVWRWLGTFFASYLPRLVERDLLTPEELEAFRAEWAQREADGTGFCVAPTMVDIVLRKS